MSSHISQRQRVLQYMENHGGITSYEAFLNLGVTRLSAVIFDLKKSLKDTDRTIETTFKHKKCEDGYTTTFAEYRLKNREN